MIPLGIFNNYKAASGENADRSWSFHSFESSATYNYRRWTRKLNPLFDSDPWRSKKTLIAYSKRSESDITEAPLLQLLGIQRHRLGEEKWIEWVRDPLCLQRVPRKRGADGTQVNKASEIFRQVHRSQAGLPAEYVAVPYTWNPSEEESTDDGEYRIIRSASDNSASPTKVRDCVLQRASKYAAYRGIDLIWTDDERINRDDPDEHEVAMQSIDLIFRFGTCPVGSHINL